jgi:SOS-response transcriptional repressor LexA
VEPELSNQEKFLVVKIKEHIISHGYSPSVRELAKASKVTPGAVEYHLKNLRAKGKLSWVKGKDRTLRVL